MAVIITQVVQLSNLPAANQGILILNLNSVFSLSLSLLRGKIITKHIDIKQRRSNYLKFSWRSKTLFSELKVFSFLFCFSRNCCWPIPILYSVLIVIVPGKIRTGNLLWKTVYNANFSLTNWSQGDRYLNIETLGLFIYLCSLSPLFHLMWFIFSTHLTGNINSLAEGKWPIVIILLDWQDSSWDWSLTSVSELLTITSDFFNNVKFTA